MARCHIIPACLIIVRFAACSDISPAPPISHAPDTTSHDWTFTMYEVGGMNTTLEDVFALSPDYALAVGKIERTGPYIRPQVNAFLWNGSSLTPISLPIDPNDTLTIDPHKHPDTQSSYAILNALWVFRHDNIWYSSEAGAIAHMTTRGADTAVKQYPYPRFGPAIASAGLRIWAKDTGEIYFAGHQSRVAKYLNGSCFPIPAGSEDEKAEEIFGTPTSLFLVTSNYPESSFKMFEDIAWRTSWKEGVPSFKSLSVIPDHFFIVGYRRWGGGVFVHGKRGK